MLNREDIINNFLKQAENQVKLKPGLFDEELIDRLKRIDSYPKISPEGLIKPGYNQYLLYLKMLVNNFSINCNIIEVGGGIIPIFAKYVAQEQLKTGFGTITVYDPKLLSSNNSEYSNMLLYKEPVTSKTDLSKYDLVIGIMPCLGTDITLKLIEEYSKDFFIVLCGCDHTKYDLNNHGNYGYRPSYNDYIEEARRICDENNLGDLIIDYLPGSSSFNNPIIYNKRKHG